MTEGMRRGSRVEDPNPASGTHPDAGKPLAAFTRITVVCNDCGDATVLDEPRLAELSAVPTFGDLWRHAFCRSCRDSGATGRPNVVLHGEQARATAAVAPEWSTKPTFGEDKSDPFPTLPRRSMFGRG